MPGTMTYIANDQDTIDDQLDFQPYVETLIEIVESCNTPLTIGIFGTWGSGKTSLMKMVRDGIPGKVKGLPEGFTVAWFDAWKYDKDETLWRALLLCVLAKVRETAQKKEEPTDALRQLETMLYRAIDIERVGGVTIDLPKAGGLLARSAVQLGLSFVPGGSVLSDFVREAQRLGAKGLTDDFTQAIQRERTNIHIEQVRFLEQFQDKFRELIGQFVKPPSRLVVFVDDLDRCLPEKAIEVLEAIKLFLDVENCVFVLGLDSEVIARGIEVKYKELGRRREDDTGVRFTIEGARYLEKIIQLPFTIPPVESKDVIGFVNSLNKSWPHDDCRTIFSVGLGDNPRQIKRAVNVFSMLWSLAERRRGNVDAHIDPVLLAKVVAIQAAYPELYDVLRETPRYLRELEEYCLNTYAVAINDGIIEVLTRSSTPEAPLSTVEPPPALKQFVSRASIHRILTYPLDDDNSYFKDLRPDQLRSYFTLVRRAEARRAPDSGSSKQAFEPQMISIPPGDFLMGTPAGESQQAMSEGLGRSWASIDAPQHKVDLSEYSIGKYPVTNLEYQAFVNDASHKPPRGWEANQHPPDVGDYPVVNVSWNDAVAYCEWLSRETGKSYRLPTEAEWEKAARGEDGRKWPWGNQVSSKNSNTAERGLRRIAPVG